MSESWEIEGGVFYRISWELGRGGGLFYMKVKKEVEGVLIVDSQVKVGKEKGIFL